MKKVKLLLLFTLILMLCMSFGVLTGCDMHTHTFGEWVEETPATCTASGTRSRACECGYKEYETIDVLKEEFTKKHDNNYCWDECIYCKREANKQTHKYSQNTCVDCKFVWQATQGLELTLLSDGSGYSVTGIGTATDTDITIPLTGYNDNLPVVAIGEEAFYACDNLIRIVIPASVTSIGNYAFANCRSLISIVIPDSVTSIGEGAFFECENLTRIVILDSVTTIGEGAFYGCSNLISIVIPDSVTSIGDYAFEDCYSLTSITVDTNNPNYKSIDGNLYTKDGKTLIQYAIGKIATTFTIPDGVTTIGDRAFCGCYNLRSIVIPDSVTTIGDYAFASCGILTSIVIPDSVTTIGDRAFYNCSSLTSITIGNGVTSIGDYAFECCDNLTSIVIPDSVTSIGNYAFEHCDSLTSVTIGSGVTSIGNYAFCFCYKLTSVTIGNGVTSIGRSAFSNTGYYDNQDNWIDGVLYIGRYLIKAKSSLSGRYTVKDTTLVIADYAFSGCNSLTSITIGNGVTSIGDYAFAECYDLTSITVDANNPNYKSIDGNLYTKDGKTLIQYAIGKTATAFTIPDSVTSIGAFAFYGCTKLTSIVIPDSVTTIGDYAFYCCENLTSIVIPDSVTSIGNYAFYNCDSLTSVTIGNGVTSIGEDAFRSCYKLTSIVIPDSVTSIGEGAFRNCANLTSVTIGNGVTSIGDRAFYCCYSLTSIVIPSSVTTIGDYAFSYCNNLTKVYYKGSASEMSKIDIGAGNESLRNSTAVYYYSETEPQLNAEGTAYDGNYWHYDADGKTPVIWTKQD